MFAPVARCGSARWIASLPIRRPSYVDACGYSLTIRSPAGSFSRSGEFASRPASAALPDRTAGRAELAAVLVDERRVAALGADAVSYTHLRAHETPEHLVCRL